jgi:alkylhydroperoxidase/carboxymuconolactone decarboxylase family protein YurZ
MSESGDQGKLDSGRDESDELYELNDMWPFPSERYLHEWAPGVLQAQNAWLSSIDSLRAPDRKTHELIRMACTVILRQAGGVERHARLAAEVGATWDEIAGSILLTEPAFGILPAIEAFPAARRGFRLGTRTAAEDDAGNDGDNNDNNGNGVNGGDGA